MMNSEITNHMWVLVAAVVLIFNALMIDHASTVRNRGWVSIVIALLVSSVLMLITIGTRIWGPLVG